MSEIVTVEHDLVVPNVINPVGVRGHLTIEMHRAGELIHREEVDNLITQVGDQWYAERAAGVAGAPAAITGMKLGAGSTAPAKTGAGAALVTYLANSHQALTGTPTSALSGSSRRLTFAATWAAGKATTASPITEVVIVIDALADATSTAANTIARALISGVANKQATDSLTITWTHDLLGA